MDSRRHVGNHIDVPQGLPDCIRTDSPYGKHNVTSEREAFIKRLSRIEDIRKENLTIQEILWTYMKSPVKTDCHKQKENPPNPSQTLELNSCRTLYPGQVTSYLDYIAAAEKLSPQEQQQTKENEIDPNESMQQFMAVTQVCRIDYQRRKDARERIQDKDKKGKEERKSEEAISEGISDSREGKEQENNLACFDVDCAKQGYLLYSYDKSGSHSILGKDVRPGGYGGSITKGNFFRKA